MAIFWDILQIFFYLCLPVVIFLLIISWKNALVFVFLLDVYCTLATFIEHFQERIDEYYASNPKTDGRVLNSNSPPCKQCFDRTLQGPIVFGQHNQAAYNPFHVASEVETFLTSPFTPLQLEAHERFQKLSRDRSPASLLRRLGAEDARCVSEEEFLLLLDILTAMFFPGTVSYEFEFLPLWHQSKLGSTQLKGKTSLVRLHPTATHVPILDGPELPGNSVLNKRALSRLYVLLHEICHAFMTTYACRQCGSGLDMIDMKGRGFPWRPMPLSVELAAQSTLGLPFDLCRAYPIKSNWSWLWCWPSKEEGSQGNLKGLPTPASRYMLRASKRGRVDYRS